MTKVGNGISSSSYDHGHPQGDMTKKSPAHPGNT
jgi:hypothetical protein